MKYKEERKTGKRVDDNIESPMDREFSYLLFVTDTTDMSV